MYVHRNLTKQLDLDEIVDAIAREHPRRIKFANILSDEVRRKLTSVYSLDHN